MPEMRCGTVGATNDPWRAVPKPENIERFIREWLQGEGHDDLVAYARCTTMHVPLVDVAGSVSSSDPRWAVGLLGRDLADNRLVLGATHAFVLTPTRFLILQLSGWKERVKAARFDVDASSVTVHYIDAVQDQGHTARYLIADLPDGSWACDAMITVKKNGARSPFADSVDAFLAALGERAQPIAYG